MTSFTNFETWFASEVERGLTDLKFAVVPGKGVSSEALQTEILASELAIASGAFREQPGVKSAIPEEILALMHRTKISQPAAMA